MVGAPVRSDLGKTLIFRFKTQEMPFLAQKGQRERSDNDYLTLDFHYPTLNLKNLTVDFNYQALNKRNETADNDCQALNNRNLSLFFLI